MRTCARERELVQRIPATSGFAPSHTATQGPPHDGGLILRMQRAAGNQAVRRMLQTKLKVSKPGDEYEREADRVADEVVRMPDGASRQDVSVPSEAPGPAARLADELTHVAQQGGPAAARAADTVRRQKQTEPKVASGATDPEKMKERCGDPCANFPWFEVAPGRFLSLCDDSVKLGYPIVEPAGCSPNGSGSVIFHAGNLAAFKPAWDLRSDYSYCPEVPKGQKVTPKIELGYIQTVERALFGGVYYKKNAANKWEWSGNEWLCVANARDGHMTSKEPWYGPDERGQFGPVPYPGNPMLADSPHIKLPSHKDGGSLRRMRLDGVFNIWLIAKRADGTIVYIHNWTIELLAVTELDDDGHPCLKSAWSWKSGGPTVTRSGPGPGSATPVLTGKTANELKKPC